MIHCVLKPTGTVRMLQYHLLIIKLVITYQSTKRKVQLHIKGPLVPSSTRKEIRIIPKLFPLT